MSFFFLKDNNLSKANLIIAHLGQSIDLTGLLFLSSWLCIISFLQGFYLQYLDHDLPFFMDLSQFDNFI